MKKVKETIWAKRCELPLMRDCVKRTKFTTLKASGMCEEAFSQRRTQIRHARHVNCYSLREFFIEHVAELGNCFHDKICNLHFQSDSRLGGEIFSITDVIRTFDRACNWRLQAAYYIIQTIVTVTRENSYLNM